jgi:uncharacterized membrane protein
MEHLILAVTGPGYMWYALPLVIAVSLVYAATRHERRAPILLHAARIGIWIVGFMAVIFAVLFFVSWLIS